MFVDVRYNDDGVVERRAWGFRRKEAEEERRSSRFRVAFVSSERGRRLFCYYKKAFLVPSHVFRDTDIGLLTDVYWVIHFPACLVLVCVFV